MAEIKTKPSDVNVADYLDTIPDAARRADCRVLLGLMHRATGEAPTMWGPSIVGFGRYRYRYASGHEAEMCLTGFASRKNDLTLYIMPGFEAYATLLARLGRIKTGKSCLYVKRLADIDLQALAELVETSVRAMRQRVT